MYRYVFLLLMICTFFGECSSWRIKNSVFYGESPTVSDMFTFNGMNIDDSVDYTKLLAKPLVVEKQQSWIDASKVLNDSLNLNVVMTGKVWINLCSTRSLELIALKVKNAIESRVPDQLIKIIRVSPVLKRVSICIEKTAQIHQLILMLKIVYQVLFRV